MVQKWFFAGAMAMALAISSAAVAGAPTDKIRDASDRIIAILEDETLKSPEKKTEKRAKMRAIVDERFDWMEMSKRSLGRYWAERTPEEKKEFTKLFGDLLERTYADRAEEYNGQPINYISETVEDGYAIVKTNFVSKEDNLVVPIEYRMRNKNNDWFVYDVVIEGVSLVNNYRNQFSEILGSSSYEKLVERIKAKMREKSADPKADTKLTQ